MDRKKIFLLIFVIFGISTCWADGSSSVHDKDLAIYTYGGGELLTQIFRSISMLIYGKSSNGLDQTFNGILRIGLTIGGFSAICLALFREKFEPLIKNFFFPSVFIMCCLLVPRTNIRVYDLLVQNTPTAKGSSLNTVKKVPFFLGKFAALVSTISHKFTQSFEGVLHGVNDPLYNWTGHIYAGENFFLSKKCRIANPVLEDNFREFCRECVFRDLGLGLYSKEDLTQAPHLLKFLEKNTSGIRTMYYRETPENDQKTSYGGSFVTCKEAIKKMNALFNNSLGNTKQILLGEIDNDFQFLLKQSQKNDLNNLIKQQIAINVLKEEIPGTLHSFSSKRAELLQRENQKILGALGANSIVAMRNFFEATIYMVFPLIILISLLSFGLKPLLNWVHFVIWVNMWPPFYVVVKFLLNTIWAYRTEQMFGKTFGLTIFTSEGLADLYSSMESIAAISLAFIPFLSWILLKGGVSQMVQLASSIMSPAQSAATTASAEKTYGNYNFGNVSLDNVNGYNAQTFRQTYSGFLSAGSVSVDSGTETMTYTPSQNALYVKQSDSYLREGISRSQAFSNTIQDSFSSSQSALKESSKGFTESLSDTAHHGAGLVDAISKQMQTGGSSNIQTTSGLQEAVQYIQGIGNDYAKAKGISHDQALREVMSAGFGFSFGVKTGLDGSYQDGSNKSEADNLLRKTFDSEAFQKQLQKITNASSGEMGHFLRGEDARFHEDFSRSLNKTNTASDQLRAAHTDHEALSKLKSYSTSENLSVHQNLNQRFVEFLSDKYKDIGKVNEILEMPNENTPKSGLIQEFVQNLLPKNEIHQKPGDIQNKYSDYSRSVKTIDPQAYKQEKETLVLAGEQHIGHAFKEPEKNYEVLKSRANRTIHQETNTIDHEKGRINKEYQTRKEVSEKETDSSVLSHFKENASSINAGYSLWQRLFGKEKTPNQGE